MFKNIFAITLFLSSLVSVAEELPVLRAVSSMSFDDVEGKRWSEEALKGKVSVINFFFASCKNVCPAMNKRLRDRTKEFLNDTRFQILSVTVDPENDTPESLKEYAEHLGSNPHWYFLRGPVKNVEKFLVTGLGIGSPEDVTLHTTRLTLVDSKGQVRAYVSSSDSDEMDELAPRISSLLSELNAKP